MTAETIAKALGGRKVSGGWIARCPTHDDREPSLSIRDAGDGKVLIRCRAGCDQRRVIAALHSRGLWDKNGHRQFTRAAQRAITDNQPDRDDAKRIKAALAIWQTATTRPTYSIAADAPLPCGAQTPFERHLAGNGRAGGEDDTPLAIHRTLPATVAT